MANVNTDSEISRLNNLIALKDQEYQEAFKNQKAFGVLRKLLSEKRNLEKQLGRKQFEKAYLV